MNLNMETKTYSFIHSNILGKKGENIVYNYLCSLPNVIDIIDVSHDRDYRKRDIDLLVVCQKQRNILKTILKICEEK